MEDYSYDFSGLGKKWTCEHTREWIEFKNIHICLRCRQNRAFVTFFFPVKCIHCQLPAEKECVHCQAGFCLRHSEEHRNLPSGSPGHLLVHVKDLRQWICSKHWRYVTHYCQEERRVLCKQCGTSACLDQQHIVTDPFQYQQAQALIMEQCDVLVTRMSHCSMN